MQRDRLRLLIEFFVGLPGGRLDWPELRMQITILPHRCLWLSCSFTSPMIGPKLRGQLTTTGQRSRASRPAPVHMTRSTPIPANCFSDNRAERTPTIDTCRWTRRLKGWTPGRLPGLVHQITDKALSSVERKRNGKQPRAHKAGHDDCVQCIPRGHDSLILSNCSCLY